MVSVLAWIALLVLQLNPALVPHRAPQPRLPKVDMNACPFEGCQFGTWTARDSLPIFKTWQTKGPPVRWLKKGDRVTALTGINITFEPARIEVTTPITNYDLKQGDIILGYMNIGEGQFNAWFNGVWVDEFDGSGVSGLGCARHCTAKLVKPGRVEWWVKIRTAEGTVGWTKDTDKFDGKDTLAGP
jgi:hypothetical protein